MIPIDSYDNGAVFSWFVLTAADAAVPVPPACRSISTNTAAQTPQEYKANHPKSSNQNTPRIQS